MVRDPVTGVRFNADNAVAIREHGGEVLYFSTQESVDVFDEDPHYYGHPDPEDDEHDHH